MADYSQTILPRLTENRLNGLDLPAGCIAPGYAGYSLANLPASICRWLNLPGLGSQPLVVDYFQTTRKHYQRVIVMVVDGFGWNLLQQFRHESPVADWVDQGLLLPLTSIAPSTTVSALASLWTGVCPAEHSLLGYEMWLKEYGLIANMILQTPAVFQGDPGGLSRSGFVPETFLPVPVMGQHLERNGAKALAFYPVSIMNSGLTRMLTAGAQVLPYYTLSDLFVSLKSTLNHLGGQPTYLSLYWGDLDTLEHRFGPNDERVKMEFINFFQQLDCFLRQVRAAGDQETLFILTADHGQIFTPRIAEYEIRRYPQLAEHLVMQPSGENRLAYFYLRPGHEEGFMREFRATFSDSFGLFPAEQVLQSGLFGTGIVNPRTKDRIGDWISIAHENAYLWWPAKENMMLGRHGGLSAQEMLVPFLALAW